MRGCRRSTSPWNARRWGRQRRVAGRCLRRCTSPSGNGVTAFDAPLIIRRIKVALTATGAGVAGGTALIFWTGATPDASDAARAAATVNAPQVVTSDYCPVSQL
jgi:hypothetical protein